MTLYDYLAIAEVLLVVVLVIPWVRSRSKAILSAAGYSALLLTTSVWHYANLWLNIAPGIYSAVRIILLLVNAYAAWKIIQFLLDKKS